MYGSPFGIFVREQPPLATGLQDVEQTVENVVQIESARLGFLARRLKKMADTLKLLPRDFAGVPAWRFGHEEGGNAPSFYWNEQRS